MMKKYLIIVLLMSSMALAQDQAYRTNNYTAWKVLKANSKNQYIEVLSVDNLKPDLLHPICINGNKMIFRYEMMGLDDSFYDKDSQAKNVDLLNGSKYKSVVFALKIDVEEDNDINGKLNAEMDKICSQNQAQRFISSYHTKSGIDSHGIIKYIGDITIKPPF